jgi:hypothetical protein
MFLYIYLVDIKTAQELTPDSDSNRNTSPSHNDNGPESNKEDITLHIFSDNNMLIE